MRLVLIGAAAWKVYAIESSPGKSVLSALRDAANQGDRHAENMIGDLETAALNGPPRSPRKVKPLKDGLLEFRRGPARGAKLRVLWFYDKGNVVICTHSFWKKDSNVQGEVQKAKKLMDEYKRAKAARELALVVDEEA